MEHPSATPERSIVTVLSVDIVGSTHHIAACEPDDAQNVFDHCFLHVQKVVADAGGLLVSYEGDGGIAVFGWPTPLEDHADHACTAGWRIHEACERKVGPGGQPLQFRVGVHSGLVGLRRLNLPGTSEFNTVGATVNLAAKLQQTAPPGGVLVSAATLNLCRNRMSVEASPKTVIAGAVELGSRSTELSSKRGLGAPASGDGGVSGARATEEGAGKPRAGPLLRAQAGP